MKLSLVFLSLWCWQKLLHHEEPVKTESCCGSKVCSCSINHCLLHQAPLTLWSYGMWRKRFRMFSTEWAHKVWAVKKACVVMKGWKALELITTTPHHAHPRAQWTNPGPYPQSPNPGDKICFSKLRWCFVFFCLPFFCIVCKALLQAAITKIYLICFVD